jgi:hypothetical protein
MSAHLLLAHKPTVETTSGFGTNRPFLRCAKFVRSWGQFGRGSETSGPAQIVIRNQLSTLAAGIVGQSSVGNSKAIPIKPIPSQFERYRRLDQESSPAEINIPTLDVLAMRSPHLDGRAFTIARRRRKESVRKSIPPEHWPGKPRRWRYLGHSRGDGYGSTG